MLNCLYGLRQLIVQLIFETTLNLARIRMGSLGHLMRYVIRISWSDFNSCKLQCKSLLSRSFYGAPGLSVFTLVGLRRLASFSILEALALVKRRNARFLLTLCTVSNSDCISRAAGMLDAISVSNIYLIPNSKLYSWLICDLGTSQEGPPQKCGPVYWCLHETTQSMHCYGYDHICSLSYVLVSCVLTFTCMSLWKWAERNT